MIIPCHKSICNRFTSKTANKNLVNAIAKGNQLVKQGIELNKQRVSNENNISGNASSSSDARFTKRQNRNKQEIDENIIAQANQTEEITKQKTALALLMNSTKA